MNVTEQPTAPSKKYRIPEIKLSRIRLCEVENPLLDTPELVADFIRKEVLTSEKYNPDVENFIVLCLNTRRRITGFQIVSTGTLDSVMVHPREVFRSAITANAAAIVVAHNHPSGDATPSEADIRVTRDLIRGGQLLKIELLDHVIIGEPCASRPKGHVSLRELQYFC